MARFAAILCLVLGASLAPFSVTNATAAVMDLTIKRDDTSLVVTGDRVAFSGVTPSSMKGKRLSLQRKASKKADWIVVGRPTVSADATWSGSGVAVGSGKNLWRVSYRKDGVTHVSPTIKTAVHQWYFLHDLDEVDDDGGYADEITIGGRNFPKSVIGGGSSDTDWIDYNLSYRCITFEAFIGIGDNSETGTTATFYVTLDGARSSVGSKGLGQATKVTLDVATRLRIRLEMDPTNNDYPSGYWAFGDARVLCSGKP